MVRLLGIDDDLRIAMDALRAGRLVAFPTETVYGLGARADDAAAVSAIYRVKGRPDDNPLIVHVADADVTGIVADWPEVARRLAAQFWPGALTIVATRHAEFPDAVSAGRPTIAVRCPDHELARRLIAGAGPLAAPSANRSGTPSPTTAAHVVDDLGDAVDVVIDGGPCRHGLESTVVDVTVDPPLVLRPGAIPIDALRAVAGSIDVHPSVDAPDVGADARAPGMRHRHYSPRAELVLYEGEGTTRLRADLDADPSAHALWIGDDAHARATVFADVESFGHALYATLRALDARDVERILVAAPAPGEDTRTLLNRLRKAASRTISS